MKVCFYCGAEVTRIEKDHAPIPQRHGGVLTVEACLTCHDMKDRQPLENWPDEWLNTVLAEMPKLSVPTKLFLLKFTGQVFDRIQQEKQEQS